MSLIAILETLFIGPLKLIFEIIFSVANRFVRHPGLSIVFLSLVMNILVLPLYRRADAMQEENRRIEEKLRDGVAHIKKTFSGDERMMMLQAYYRQNNYKPTDALNGSVSLLLEVPFFMAAYQFLSKLELLNGVSLGPIADLGAPDGMLVIGGVAINVLPVLMTLVNVISSALYLKGFPLKTKIQLYGMAGFFLVFLYTSPAGLVFYWTLNNVFSLVKTIFYKLKNPQKVLRILMAVCGVALLAFAGFLYNDPSMIKRLVLFAIGGVLLLPLIWNVLKALLPATQKAKAEPKPNKKLFVTGTLFMTVLIGLVIPSTYIAASPQEFVDMTYFYNPLWYIVSAAALAAGTFLVWLRVFYWLASPKGKVVFDRLVWVLCGVMLVNYMFFGTDLGIISSALQYEEGMSFQVIELLVNVFVVAALSAVLYLCAVKWKQAVAAVLVVAIVALGGMSTVNMVRINRSVETAKTQLSADPEQPQLTLSKDGQNVVVLLIDRAMGAYVPYMFKEKPELQEKFSGFTYYSNTMSYGACTNFAAPPVYGGYEYTPEAMNLRDTESLKDKNNEAIKMLPVLFSQNGFDVTVCDPPYGNYQWNSDLSIYDEYPGIDAYATKGKFTSVEQKQYAVESNMRNFFCFGIMKTMPLFVQTAIYDSGRYNAVATLSELTANGQTRTGVSTATGVDGTFLSSYNVLNNLSDITDITASEKDTFLFFYNDMTHMPALLEAGTYMPALNVDNTAYDAANTDRFTVDGSTLKVESDYQMAHYHTNIAAMLQLGNWFDYLKENGVYDNTKIIIVSDHGFPLWQKEELTWQADDTSVWDMGSYFPLLMVKDFGSKEFTTSDEFMTNADVPVLALKDVVENPVNPFTGKPITNTEKTDREQYIITSYEHDVAVNNGNQFFASAWIGVKGTMLNQDNWTYLKDATLLPSRAGQ